MIRYVSPREKPIKAFELFSKNPIQLTKYQLIFFIFVHFYHLKLTDTVKIKLTKEYITGIPFFPVSLQTFLEKTTG